MGSGPLTASAADAAEPRVGGCTDCALKHIGAAAALYGERIGYPSHVWRAVGHLVEAERELSRFAAEIRELRHMIVSTPEDCDSHFDELIEMIVTS